VTEGAVGAGLAVTAVLARAALDPLTGDRAPFALGFVAVVCATLFAGWRSGLVAVVIGQGLTWYLLVRPTFSFALLSDADAASLITATASQLVVVAIVALYQREIETQQRHRDILVGELNHRVKNMLAVVQSLAHQTLGRAAPGEMALFDGRLQALARAHNLLTERNWSKAALSEVIETALRPFAIPTERLRIEGPPVAVAPQTAVNLTLVLHELATNAMKYGALSNGQGGIEIAWTAGEDLPRALTWRERGGPRVEAPRTTGFGTRLIQRGLASELGAKVKLDFDPDGLVCSIESRGGED
jgi:two-component sensor histidine kinase